MDQEAIEANKQALLDECDLALAERIIAKPDLYDQNLKAWARRTIERLDPRKAPKERENLQSEHQTRQN